MPISIALGLTVLSFLFVMTTVPIEAVALKLFTGHRELRDHGDPVLHSGRQFPDPWRRRSPHDRVCHLDGRPLVWRPGSRRRDGLRAVCRRVRLFARDRGRDRLDHAAGDGEAGLSETLRRRRHRHLGRARHPDSALDRDGAGRGGDRRQRGVRSGGQARAVGLGRRSCSWPASSRV